MTLITIPGMTEDSLLNMDTNPSGMGFRPFPCTPNDWTKHTAHVIKAEIKSFDNGGDNLSIVVANVMHGGEILINLDPSRVGPGVKDPEKQAQRNLESLTRAIKILGAHTKGQLDLKKLEKASGQVVEILAKHKGFREKDGRFYHKVSLILTGTAKEEVDVTDVPMPEPPNAVRTSAPAASFQDEQDPFFS